MRLIFFPHPSSLKFYFKLCNKILNVFNCSTHNYANSLTVFKIAERYKRLSMRKFFFLKNTTLKKHSFLLQYLQILIFDKTVFPLWRSAWIPFLSSLFCAKYWNVIFTCGAIGGKDFRRQKWNTRDRNWQYTILVRLRRGFNFSGLNFWF